MCDKDERERLSRRAQFYANQFATTEAKLSRLVIKLETLSRVLRSYPDTELGEGLTWVRDVIEEFLRNQDEL